MRDVAKKKNVCVFDPPTEISVQVLTMPYIQRTSERQSEKVKLHLCLYL